MPEENVNQSLHPAYEPADSDSALLIQFIGNTARIHTIGYNQISPEHMLAAAERLRIEAEIRIASEIQKNMMEQAAQGLAVPAREGQILTPGQLPT